MKRCPRCKSDTRPAPGQWRQVYDALTDTYSKPRRVAECPDCGWSDRRIRRWSVNPSQMKRLTSGRIRAA